MQAPRRARRRVGRNIETGSVLQRTFAIWARNVVPYSLLAIVLAIPVYVYSYFAARVEPSEGGWLAWIPAFLLGIVVSFITSGFITYSVFQQLRGSRVSMLDCLQATMSRLIPIMVVATVAGILIGLGAVALVVPGIILLCMFYVVVPIAVVETPGVIATLKRSHELTNGHKWSILVLVIILGILVGITSGILTAVLSIPTEPNSAMATAIEAIISAAFGAIGAVAQTIVYHDLRTGKEGIDVDQLIAVFE